VPFSDEACATPKLAAYIDDKPRTVLRPAYLNRIRDMTPLTKLRVMVDGLKPGLAEDQRWTARDLEALRGALPDHELVITYWLSAYRQHLAELRAELPELVDAAKAVATEADLEGSGKWSTRHVRGFPSLAFAGNAAVGMLREVLPDLPVEGSTFPGHIELRRPAFMRHVDVANVQLYPIAYKVVDGERRVRSWDGRHGPWRRVREGMLAALKRLPESVEATAALPAWRQTWIDPPTEAEWTMREVILAWEYARCESSGRVRNEVAYWSGKHLWRTRPRCYTAPFIMATFV
jgi:hypothetical protein